MGDKPGHPFRGNQHKKAEAEQPRPGASGWASEPFRGVGEEPNESRLPQPSKHDHFKIEGY